MGERVPCERALVVDDNEDMLSTMRDVLELAGVTVETAGSVERAREILAGGFRPSVVIVDLRLAGQSGETLADELRADARYRDVPLVAMSGDIQSLRRLGGAFHRSLGKPFGVDELVHALEDLCDGRRGPGELR